MEIQLGTEIQLGSLGCGAGFLFGFGFFLLLTLQIINKCVPPGVEIT